MTQVIVIYKNKHRKMFQYFAEVFVRFWSFLKVPYINNIAYVYARQKSLPLFVSQRSQVFHKTGLQSATLLKERLRQRNFPVNFVKFLGIYHHRATASVVH